MKCLETQIEKRLFDDENPELNRKDRLVCSLCNNHKALISLPSQGVKGLKTNFSFENLVSHLKLEDTVAGTSSSDSKQKQKPARCTSCLSRDEKIACSDAHWHIDCPICKDSVHLTDEGIQGIKTNTAFKNRLKTITYVCDDCRNDKAISRCTVCNENLCFLCDRYHKKSVATKQHHIEPLYTTSHIIYQMPIQKKESGSVKSMSIGMLLSTAKMMIPLSVQNVPLLSIRNMIMILLKR